MFLDLNEFQISHRKLVAFQLDCWFVIGRNTRNGTPSIETVPEDSGSFSEIVRAVFYFFQRKPKKSKGMISFSKANMQVLGRNVGEMKACHLVVSLLSLCFTGACWTSLSRSC